MKDTEVHSLIPTPQKLTHLLQDVRESFVNTVMQNSCILVMHLSVFSSQVSVKML